MKTALIVFMTFINLACKADILASKTCAPTPFQTPVVKNNTSYALFIPVMYYFWLNNYDRGEYSDELNEALKQSGLKHIYHDEEEEDEVLCGVDIFGRNVKADDKGNPIATDKHACYISMLYDTSSFMEVGFIDKDDAQQFVEDIKPYTTRIADFAKNTYIELISGFLCVSAELDEEGNDDELLEKMQPRLNENGWWVYTISRDF